MRTASQIVAALKGCGKLRDLEGGKRLHLDAVAARLESSSYVGAALIGMYSKCRSMELARQVFNGVADRNVFTWNALILGYVQNGQSSLALDLFTGMECRPNSVTYVAALKACGSLASEKDKEPQRRLYLEKGIAIHKQVNERGFESDVFVANTLVDMYSKCGSMDRAKEVFDRMKLKNVVTWTSLILGYAQNGQSSMAMDLFATMDCEPYTVTYIAALKACGGLAAEKKKQNFYLHKGIVIHKQVKERGFESDVFVSSSLVDMYSKCGSMDRAREVFDGMSSKNVVTWNCLIQGYVQNGESLVALDLSSAMTDCEKNSVTYVAALKACGSLAATEKESGKSLWLDRGMIIHKQLQECGFEKDLFVASSLIDMYSKCGSMDRAKEVFDRMVLKNVVAWTSLILGYAENGESSVAMELFTAMDCRPNAFTYVAVIKACGGLASEDESKKNLCLEKGSGIHEQVKERGLDDSEAFVASSLVDMYCKCGSMDRAREVFEKSMSSRTVVSWTSLIMGYVQNGQSSVAMELFTAMDCEPNSVTYVAALKACANLAALPAGQQIHARICRLGLEQDQSVATTLMDFYGKCGSGMSRAEELFNNMNSPGVVSWNALIAGYSSCGEPSQVFNLVRKMQQETGVQGDARTFVCVLTACSRAGLVQKGELVFESMLKQRPDVKLSVEHYTCMVDMLGRANKLQKALALIKQMPFEADAVLWMTLLGACRKHKNLEVGKAAFDALVAAGTTDSAAYVLMSDIYASLSMREDLKRNVDCLPLNA